VRHEVFYFFPHTVEGNFLHIQSDASYLSRTKSRSVAGGILYCDNIIATAIADAKAHAALRKDTPTKARPPLPAKINGAILAISHIIPGVPISATEAEYATAYICCKEGLYCRSILTALKYPQPPTNIFCDNECAIGIANDTKRPRKSKCMVMQYDWLRKQIHTGDFTMAWFKGTDNIADFFNKALPVIRHQELKPFLVCNYSNPYNPALSKRARRTQLYVITLSNSLQSERVC
jgi:hypothetical protein